MDLSFILARFLLFFIFGDGERFLEPVYLLLPVDFTQAFLLVLEICPAVCFLSGQWISVEVLVIVQLSICESRVVQSMWVDMLIS